MPVRAWPLVPLTVAFAGGIAAAPAASLTGACTVGAVAVGVGGALLGLARPTAATAAVLLAVGAVGVLRGLAPPAPAPSARPPRRRPRCSWPSARWAC